MPTAIVDKKQGTYVIPAQHTDRLRNILMGVEACPVPRERIVQQIFSADYSEVLSVPLCNIVRLPTTEQKAARLVQCANFRPEDPSSCSMGDRCKFVHAIVNDAPRHSVHINYAWPDLETVTYERFAPGKTLKVAAPSSKTITDVMESHMVLKTKALTGTRRPLSHCAHYYFNRTCNLGNECQFIHAVFIDPTAKPYQRAPAPTQLGRPRRGRELQQDHIHGDDAVLAMNEISPQRHDVADRYRSPGGESSVSDHYAPGDNGGLLDNTIALDPLTAAMLTPQTTPAATPTTTPRHSRAPIGDHPPTDSPCVGGSSFPGQPGVVGLSNGSFGALHRENSGRVTPGAYRHTPYGSRQNSFAI